MSGTLEHTANAELNGIPPEAAGDAAAQSAIAQIEALRALIRRQSDAIKQLQEELESVRSDRDTYVLALRYYWKDDLRPFTEEEIRELNEHGCLFSDAVKELRRELEAKK